MQKLFTLLGAALLLVSNILFAQNCPTDPTYKNQNGNFDLSTGRSFVINDGKSYTVTIQNNFSATSSICITNGSTLNLKFSNLNSPVAGGSIYVDGTSKLNLIGSNVNNFPLTIINYGAITQSTIYNFKNGAIINNYGTYTASSNFNFNSGAITLNNSGNFTFSSLVQFNTGTFAINNLSTGVMTFNSAENIATVNFSNKGTAKFNGSVVIQNDARFYNSGYIYLKNTSDLTINDGNITNYGIINTQGFISLNKDGALVNYCTIICGQDFSNNNGTVTNNGKLLLTTTAPGYLFFNQGVFVNGPNGFVQGYDYHNTSGSITGGGNFYFTNTTKNQTSFNGSAANHINFYDATPCSLGNGCSVNDIFDVQNTTPLYTTKNKITPVTDVNTTACGDPASPVITTQPQTAYLCNSSTTSATFYVVASSPYSSISYQWSKNGNEITGATASSYTATNLTPDDTANVYSVALTNSYGTTISNAAGVKYIILVQPINARVATGNAVSFTIQTSGETTIQWYKNSTSILNANLLSYNIPEVNLADSGKYTALVTYTGGTCVSNSAVLKPAIILYSKANGNLNEVTTWGINTNGTGSTPVNFTREEHTFVVANRTEIETGDDITMAGTLDLANGIVNITPGSTLNVGRIIRSADAGAFSGSATSSLTVHGISNSKYAGASDLYFKPGANVLQYLTTAAHVVTLHHALNITAGSNPGWLQVNSGTFETSNLLTLKSDALGTAIVAESYGTINGKATIERYMPARRAWRIMCAPVTAVDAPTINAAWQEGATNSTDNPQPGYGTHITYGSIADGFDQNPQKTFSMYYFNTGKWYGIPATNKTPVTNYPAYLFFVRGDRSYDITNTTNTTTPSPTILRTTGYLNQGQQADIIVNNTGFTLVPNPYASPIDFEKMYNNASNVKHTIRVWDPSLAGSKGVGAYVTLDWTGSSYKATPTSSMTNIIQPYQAFFIQSNTTGTIGKISINEEAKNIKTVTNPFGRSAAARETQDGMLEINLNVFNDDSTTGIADGVLYRFNDAYSNSVDEEDVDKLSNLYENLGILSNNMLLTIERRVMPVANDTLHLYLTGTKTTSYQLEIIPQAFGKNAFLYDSYVKQFYPINPSDTNRFTISINTADALSKAANRFSIVLQNSVVLPVTFSSAKAYAKGKTVQVEWKVANETEVQYYEIEKSANGTSFTKAGEVKATGAISYSFNDATPFDGDSYYRIKSVDKSGKTTYTTVMPVTISNNAVSSLRIYPNPLKGKSFQIQFSNKTAGTYRLELVSSSGKQLFTQNVHYNGGTATFTVQLKNALASGLYFVKATAADGTTEVIKAIVQ
ncbi:hypothetical protein FC093_10870 [Ilyomonas limi]|uniref:Secretion system C-terminal sorting domain-containing protein n=1 Tax=Ilyomonas limi TaxID=2575867 RepID=A0A4U3L2Y6_9BACT|nr:T9SS type A sorting domain-containing protein [Ilyomonas limi]TKK68614.1 hypothetical protein FC093_10870 [Ilyomonas limi]